MRLWLAAAALAATMVVVAFGWQSTSIGGADQYAYVTEAGLFGRGELIVRQEIVHRSPWPGADGTWIPIGYTGIPGAPSAMTSVVSPGLPLLMAALQRLFGFCAAFWVVPICAGLTIWLTFRLGARVFGRPDLGLAAAALMAISPTFLAQAVSPLSDVPATAAWLLTLVLLVEGHPTAAGLAAAIAIAVRPNLVPISLGLLTWTALRDMRNRPMRGVPVTVRLALGIALAVGGIAWLNARLYGSPIRSGYGGLEGLFAWKYLSTNVLQFTEWTAGTETPLVALAAVFFIAPAVLPPSRIANPRVLLGGFVAIVIASYLFYLPFTGWSYLRFLLPAWPIVMLLTAVGVEALAARWLPAGVRSAALPVVLGLLALHHVPFAIREHVFARWRDEARYVDVAKYIAATTEPSAVFVSWQESGSIRLYADRLTLNFARLDRRWLDRAVDRLQAMGRRPYFVVEGFEIDAFRQRFGADNRFGLLDWTPIAVFQEPYVAIYDPYLREPGRTPVVIPRGAERWPRRCRPPAVWPPRL
jgi:hypothetical protein